MQKIADMLKDKNKVVLIHSNADMDALASALALSRAYPPATIYAPGGMDRVTSMVTEKMNIEVLDSCDLNDYELVVAVDTSSPEQFKPAVESVPEGSVVIDHHLPTGKWEGMNFFCDNTRVSCCEIIKEMIDADGRTCDRDTALVMLGGMLTDSGHFQYANPRLMDAFSDIMKRFQIPMDEAMNLVHNDVSMSERIAVMKALERSKFDRVGDMIVATSYGGSFEAASCRALMLSGADVVFVGSQREDEFRLSSRATQEMVRRGIHLGNIMGDISSETTDTDGGGHGGAAGLSGVGDVEAILHICMMRTMDEFRRIKNEMNPI